MINALANLWLETAQITRNTARNLRETNDYRSCASRAYYATYQIATATCIAHGDVAQFPTGWNNPSHDQLPELIKNNGDLPLLARRRVVQGLRLLRDAREIADYKMGQTVDLVMVRDSIITMEIVFPFGGLRCKKQPMDFVPLLMRGT